MATSCRRDIIGTLTKFQLSGAYPIVFAILCAISGSCGKAIYIPILSLLTVSIVFSALFVKDNKVFIPPCFMMYCGLGTDNKQSYNSTKGDVFSSIDQDAWICIIILAIIIAAALITRFIADGTFKSALRSRGVAFWGIIFLDVAFLTNGLFFVGWSVFNLLFGLLLAFSLTAFYLLFCSILNRADGQIVKYVCRCMVLTSYLVLAQMLIKIIPALATNTLIYYHDATSRLVFDRELFSMSWGITTVVGGILILGISAALYLAACEKRPVIYSLSAVAFASAPSLMNTRSSMLVGLLILFVGAIIVSVWSKNRRINLIFFASLLFAVALAITATCVYLNSHGLLSRFLDELWLLARFDIYKDRLDLLIIGAQHFTQNPVFGVGILTGTSSGGIAVNNIFGNMYHNIPMQFAASMGCVGIAAFMFHIKDLFAVGAKKPDVGRILLLLTPVAIILLSLVDNFFFYPNFHIFYTVFLVLAEKDLKTKRTV